MRATYAKEVGCLFVKLLLFCYVIPFILNRSRRCPTTPMLFKLCPPTSSARLVEWGPRLIGGATEWAYCFRRVVCVTILDVFGTLPYRLWPVWPTYASVAELLAVYYEWIWCEIGAPRGTDLKCIYSVICPIWVCGVVLLLNCLGN